MIAADTLPNPVSALLPAAGPSDPTSAAAAESGDFAQVLAAQGAVAPAGMAVPLAIAAAPAEASPASYPAAGLPQDCKMLPPALPEPLPAPPATGLVEAEAAVAAPPPPPSALLAPLARLAQRFSASHAAAAEADPAPTAKPEAGAEADASAPPAPPADAAPSALALAMLPNAALEPARTAVPADPARPGQAAAREAAPAGPPAQSPPPAVPTASAATVPTLGLTPMPRPRIPADTARRVAIDERAPAQPVVAELTVLADAPRGDSTLPLAAAPVLASPTTLVPAAPSAADAPRDFAQLVDRLVASREAATGTVQPVQVALAHAEFGRVSLSFRNEDSGLSVALASADPDFARAVQAAAPVAPPAAPTDASASREQPRTQADTASDNRQSSRGQPDQRDQRDQRPAANPSQTHARAEARRRSLFA